MGVAPLWVDGSAWEGGVTKNLSDIPEMKSGQAAPIRSQQVLQDVFWHGRPKEPKLAAVSLRVVPEDLR